MDDTGPTVSYQYQVDHVHGDSKYIYIYQSILVQYKGLGLSLTAAIQMLIDVGVPVARV